MKADRRRHEPVPGIQVTRREFLKLTGSGILVFFTLGELPFFPREAEGEPLPTDFNAFLKIGEDGRVSCFTGKIEMGQGVITSLAQMLADELEVSIDSVDMVMGDTDLCPWDMGTFGSRTTRFFGPPLRAAAAEARAVLMFRYKSLPSKTAKYLKRASRGTGPPTPGWPGESASNGIFPAR
jgi:nicotinate dehydrogenase subunit B